MGWGKTCFGEGCQLSCDVIVKKPILVLVQVLGGSFLKFQGKEKPKQQDQVESLFCLLLWAITAQVTNEDYLCSGFSMLPFHFQCTSVNHLSSSTAKTGKMNDDITQWNKLRQKKIQRQPKNPIWKETQRVFLPIKSIKGTHTVSFPLGHNCKPHNGKRHSKQAGQKKGANAWLIWKYLSPVADIRSSASSQVKAPAELHTHGLDQPLAHEWQSKNLTSCRTQDIAESSGHRVWGDQRNDLGPCDKLLWGTTNTINKAFGFLETNAFLLGKFLPRFQVTRFHLYSVKDKFIKKSWSCHTHLLSNVSNSGFPGFPLEEADPFVLFGCPSLTRCILAMQRPEPHTLPEMWVHHAGRASLRMFTIFLAFWLPWHTELCF